MCTYFTAKQTIKFAICQGAASKNLKKKLQKTLDKSKL